MKEIVTEKRCSKCEEIRPIEAFPKIGAKCKACLRAYQNEWESRHPEKRKAYQRKSDTKRAEKKREQRRERTASNPEKYRNATKKWRRENPEKVKETSRLWRERNKDKVSEYNRRQRLKFPEKTRLNNEKRRAREKGATGTITAKEWGALLERYGHKCLRCGQAGVKLTLDHVLPLAMGGNHTINNAQCLCSTCNSIKGAKHIDYR